MARRPAAPATVAADNHDVITVVGARVNNLANVSVKIPKRRLTVVTGVSGSGKSSLVFGTIAAESQRLINETYSTFVQGFMPTLSRPDVDVLDGLTPAIIVDQQRLSGDIRSTVGTATDASALLRILFSRFATPHIGSPQAYSFNVASVSARGAMTVERGNQKAVRVSYTRVGGMCPTCEGIGTVSDLDLTEVIDDSKSLREGALLIPGWKVDSWWTTGVYIHSGFLDPDKPISRYTKAEMADLLYKEPTKVKINGVNLTYEGLIPKIEKSILSRERDKLQPALRDFVERAATFTACRDCDGTRLSAAARSSRINGMNIADAAALQVTELAGWVQSLESPGAAPLVASLTQQLDAFSTIGLGYLSLDRPTSTLSGGEAQRVKMIRQLGSALTDVTYVFDEPTAGLHPHDIGRMNELLGQLRDKGNTVLVVEHKPDVIRIADHIIDVGPGAGAAGGTLCFEGTVDELVASATITGQHLADRPTLKAAPRAPTGSLPIRGATLHNLKDVDVDIPLGVLVVITGVAGSGKSSLVHGCMPADANAITVDQRPIRGSRRSNPATYTGLLDPIRKAFAKANSVKPALFSANSDGACPTCAGLGVIYTDLAIMASMASVCEECDGKRFSADVLALTLAGRSISDVLAMSVDEARAFFSSDSSPLPAAVAILRRLTDVGLGYLTIGQPLTTLSGGERQRLKLATHLGERGGLYVLDEITTGLHLADVQQMLGLLDTLVDAGKSLIVIEHHVAVMAHADWIIDLGPGAGHDGGRIVFEGTPAAMVADPATLTAQHLAAALDASTA